MKKGDLFSVRIITKRLILVPISLKYKKDIFREFTKEITSLMFPTTPSKIKETEEFILDSIKDMKKNEILQMVILNKRKEFLGCVGLHHIDKKNPELGVWLKKSAYGNSYGKEAIFALKKWADENIHYDSLLYPVDKDNIASRKIPESMNGKIFKKYNQKSKSGKVLHILEYGILRD